VKTGASGKKALVVVDMLNDFVRPGAPWRCRGRVRFSRRSVADSLGEAGRGARRVRLRLPPEG